MVVIVLTVIVVGLVYKRYSKRRAQKRVRMFLSRYYLMAHPASIRYPQAAKLASLHRAISSRVNATDETLSGSDEVMVIETRRVVERESMPPPYSMPTPPPNDSDSDPSEDLPHFTIPERKCEMSLFESMFIDPLFYQSSIPGHTHALLETSLHRTAQPFAGSRIHDSFGTSPPSSPTRMIPTLS